MQVSTNAHASAQLRLVSTGQCMYIEPWAQLKLRTNELCHQEAMRQSSDPKNRLLSQFYSKEPATNSLFPLNNGTNVRRMHTERSTVGIAAGGSSSLCNWVPIERLLWSRRKREQRQRTRCRGVPGSPFRNLTGLSIIAQGKGFWVSGAADCLVAKRPNVS